ncbi:MAG: flippase-like domain-containing protein [Candidatus Omnitrophica bacterium]|nr:flippase-like domain-containing protein [Candidatus Omnitrophota bacterium]
MNKTTSFLIRAGISGTVIAGLFYALRHESAGIIGSVRGMPRTTLLEAVALYFCVNALMSLRLHCIFQGQKIQLTKRECLRLTFIGAFFNNFLPTGAGGDVMKGYLAAKQTQRKMGVAVTVLMDRMIGLAMLVLVASLAGVVLSYYPVIKIPENILNASYLLLAVMASVTVFFLVPSGYKLLSEKLTAIPLQKIKPLATQLLETVDQYRKQKPLLLKAMVFSFLAQFAFAGVVHLLSKGLGVALPVFHLVLILPLIHMATLIPSINGLGVREGALVYLLGETMGVEKAFSLAILSTGILISLSLLVGGTCYILLLWKNDGGSDDHKGITGNFGLSDVQRTSAVGRE